MPNCKRFILLGDAGAGKSSFINFLHNYFYGTTVADQIFCHHPKVKLAIPCANWSDFLDQDIKTEHSERNINDQRHSQTQKCTSYVFKRDDIHLEIIDTPGFNDTNGTDVDKQNISLIEAALKEIPFLSGIILVVNGAFSRLGTPFKNFLHLLRQVCPNNLLNNCVAILTNCDELSVNLDPSILCRDLNVDDRRIFHLQNSLFRWDRQNYSPKTISRFKQDFEDNVDKIKQLEKTLLQLNNVSTEIFQAGAIKILVIERYVSYSVHDMIQLLRTFKEQQVAQVGIQAAQHMMQNNKEWDKQREISAIRWMEVPPFRSPSPSPLKPKKMFTQETFLKDHSETSTIISQPKDHQPDNSTFSNSTQKKNPSNPHYYDPPSTQTDVMVNNDRKKFPRQIHSDSCQHEYGTRKHSSSQPTSSQNTNYYPSAYDSHSNKNQPIAESSSQSSRCHSTTEAGEQYNKYNPSPPFVYDNRHQNRYSASPHTSSRDSFHSHAAPSNRPVYRQEQTKIQVTIPDNEARSYHDSAQRQKFALTEREQHLINQQQILASSMMSLLEQLKKQVDELRSINRNYDLIERNRELLLEFKEMIQILGDDARMQRYYDESVKILSNKEE